MASPLPRPDELSAELLRHWRAADPADLAAGAGWYPAATREAERIAALAPRGVGLSRAAAIIAALSPRQHWAVNLRWAEAIATAASYGEPCPAVGFTGNRRKAWAIATGEARPERELSGPKVRRFWRNLTGDLRPVTIDVWACRAVGWTHRELGRRGWYEALETAHQLAADQVGVEPAALQAGIWMHLRGARPADPEPFRPMASVGCES